MLVEFAPAKINLTLRVIKRRADGYHEIESLVAFAQPSDRLSFAPGAAWSLSVDGPTAAKAGAAADNLVLKAARLLAADIPGLGSGRFDLEKHLPVAAGIGGGSSDAAAALRLLAQANGLKLDDARLAAAARATGADVPVCVDPRPRVMRGIGEILSQPLPLPDLPALLVNPGVAIPTAEVFSTLAALRAKDSATRARTDPAVALVENATAPITSGAMIEALARSGNDLERPAIVLQDVIADTLSELRGLPGCRLARMSGSGATCFALFDQMPDTAAQTLKARHPGWWVCTTTIGSGQ